jgi:hypothetical protein
LYPRVQGKIDYFEVSTPSTIEHYLRATDGGAVGLDQTPTRFTDVGVQHLMDTQTKVLLLECFFHGFFPLGSVVLRSWLVFDCVVDYERILCEHLMWWHRSLGCGKLGKIH